MAQPGVLILSAPSGAGKTSLARALVEMREDAGITVSHTTRPIRPGEVDGEHYHFVDQLRFEQMIADNAFIEYAMVFGNYYGTSISAINEQLNQGIHAVLDIDWQGARAVRGLFENAYSIFIMPPSLAVLERRLQDRKQDDSHTIARRMQEALNEISHKDEYDLIIINDDFDKALGLLDEKLSSI